MEMYKWISYCIRLPFKIILYHQCFFFTLLYNPRQRHANTDHVRSILQRVLTPAELSIPICRVSETLTSCCVVLCCGAVVTLRPTECEISASPIVLKIKDWVSSAGAVGEVEGAEWERERGKEDKGGCV